MQQQNAYKFFSFCYIGGVENIVIFSWSRGPTLFNLSHEVRQYYSYIIKHLGHKVRIRFWQDNNDRINNFIAALVKLTIIF